jgi:hypothetical protein
MKVRSSVKAGGLGTFNHSQTQQAPVVRTGIKAGGLSSQNHSQTQS